MKLPPLHWLLAIALLTAWKPLAGQTADDSDTETPPPAGSTTIDSDILHSDQTAHKSVFTGNVVVLGTNFKMTCQEMTVYFTNDNKVARIVATGNVVINQPDRVTNCGHAEYFHDSDMFVLTDQPVIHDHKNVVTGPEIDIFRTTQKMVVKGRSHIILGPDSMGSPNPSPTPISTDNK
jgi:lipopolysaccharide transport protein LptA